MRTSMFKERASVWSDRQSALLVGWGVVLIVLAFVGGWFLGSLSSQSVVALEDGSVISKDLARQIEGDVEFALFWEVWDLLQGT